MSDDTTGDALRGAEDDADEAIREFLRKADNVYGEYEQGYANADATLRKLQDHIRQLRQTVQE